MKMAETKQQQIIFSISRIEIIHVDSHYVVNAIFKQYKSK